MSTLGKLTCVTEILMKAKALLPYPSRVSRMCRSSSKSSIACSNSLAEGIKLLIQRKLFLFLLYSGHATAFHFPQHIAEVIPLKLTKLIGIFHVLKIVLLS